MQNICDFISTQSEIVVNKIYGSADPEFTHSPWACKAIFSSLSALSKNYVNRLLFIENPLSSSDIQKWIKPQFILTHNTAIGELIKLRILKEINHIDDTESYLQMNQFFRNSFQSALCYPKEPWLDTNISLLKPDKKAPSYDDLDKFSINQWNEVLRCLLNITGSGSDMTIETFLRSTGLITVENGRTITAIGYEYMLRDQQSQVILLIIKIPFPPSTSNSPCTEKYIPA